MSEIILDGNHAILPDAGVVVSVIKAGTNTNKTAYGVKTNRNPIVKRPDGTKGIAFWGKKNDFPQRVIKELALNPVLVRTLDDKVCYAQGIDVLPVIPKIVDGKKVLEIVDDPEIWDFLDQNSTQSYFNEAFTNLFTFYNGFAKLTKSIDHTKILQIDCEDSSFCRLSDQNEEGISDLVYVNANWPAAKFTDKETITYQALNPYSFTIEQDAYDIDDHEFIYPFSYATPGKTFYQLAHFMSFLDSEWNPLLTLIPKYKRYLIENQITLKYHIQLPQYYFEEKYGDVYRKADDPRKLEIRKKELQEWNDFLANVENTGNSFASIYKVMGDKAVPGVKIESIENKIKDGQYISDNQEAFSLLLYALGMDPALLGFAPGAKMGSGSGSDKREAFLIFLSKVTPYRKKVLEPLNFIAQYNGWKNKYPRMRFVFEDAILTTLDKGKDTESTLESPKGGAAS
jgi:hypothetical protein